LFAASQGQCSPELLLLSPLEDRVLPPLLPLECVPAPLQGGECTEPPEEEEKESAA